MTVGECRERVLKLLDESKPKNDLTGKIPVFMDMAQREVVLYCPILRRCELGAGAVLTEMPEDCRRVRFVLDAQGVPVRYRTWIKARRVMLEAPGAAIVEYEARPEDLTKASEDEELELPEEAALAVVLYVAAQCNSMEYDQRFFQSFYAQYQGKLQNLAAETVGAQAWVEPAEAGTPSWM